MQVAPGAGITASHSDLLHLPFAFVRLLLRSTQMLCCSAQPLGPMGAVTALLPVAVGSERDPHSPMVGCQPAGGCCCARSSCCNDRGGCAASPVNRCGCWAPAKLPFRSLIWIAERCRAPRTPSTWLLNNTGREAKIAATKLLAYGLLMHSYR